MEGIIPIYNRNAGCDYHRIIMPYKHLGIDLAKYEGKKFEEFAKTTRAIVYNRTCKSNLFTYIAYRARYGFKIIVDLDDYWELYPRHVLYNHWVNNKVGEDIVNNIMNADAVTVTTALLADKVKKVAPKVPIYVLPNALPYGKEQFNEFKIQSKDLRFMYTGGDSHFWDIQQLKVPFLKINNDPNLNAQFKLAGYHPDYPKQWNAMENSFSLNGKLRGYKRVNFKPLNDYMSLYNGSDVCLAPLEDNNFNRFKSNLKMLEAGCKFNPLIASDVSPYADEKDRAAIMYAKNSRDWFDYIKYCIKNPEFVADSGQYLGEYVRREYNLDKINEERRQVIEHIVK